MSKRNYGIIYNQGIKVDTNTNGKDIPIGTIFTGKIGGYDDKLFIMTFVGVISLENPNITWKCPSVTNYKPVDCNIVVEE